MDHHDLEPEGWQDPLTGLEGPDFFNRVLVAEVGRASRYRRALTVVLIELEGVDDVAEARGPDDVRRLLHAAGQALLRTTRPSEYCARLEGARFGVILTETDEISAINFVERVRISVPRALPRFADGVRLRAGWASPTARESAGALVVRARQRLLADVVS